jgi:hypothetical protein
MTTEQLNYDPNNNDPITGTIFHVLENTAGDPLYNAEVGIKKKLGPDVSKTVKRTGTDGMAVFYPLDPVEYLYDVDLNGYTLVSGSFFVTSGNMTQVTVRLRSI